MSWNESTRASASSLEIVNRSSMIHRAAAAPSDAASTRSRRIRSSRSSGRVSSRGALPSSSSRRMPLASSAGT
jgi:hypothetical protein